MKRKRLRMISLKILKLLEANEEILYERGKIKMEIYPLGSEKDDLNPHKIYKLKGGLMFPVIIENNEDIKYQIYEDELGGIMIKFTYEGKMVGRGCIPYCLMKEGYRRIRLFDNNCLMCETAYAVGYFKKSRYIK